MPAMTAAESSAVPPAGASVPAPKPRLAGLDAARALAIVGMVVVNVGPRGEPGLAGFFYHLPVGRASVLFVVLAGIGMTFLTRSARRPGGSVPWRPVLWRALLLLVGGLALQLPDHDVSVILPAYGVLFLLSLPLLKAPTAVLGFLTVVLLALGPVCWLLLQIIAGRRFQFTAPDITDAPGTILTGILFTGAYPVVVWCVPFLLGMLLGRINLAEHRNQRHLLTWGAAAAIVGYGLSRALVQMFGQPADTVGWDRLLSAVGHSQMPLWLVSSIGSAVAIIGALLLAGRMVSRHLSVLVSAGRMALSIYVAHLLVLAAWIRPEPHTLVEGYIISIVLSLALLLLAHLWSMGHRFGPLERLLRLPDAAP
jgi:uncharacterized membrane protein YeiB